MAVKVIPLFPEVSRNGSSAGASSRTAAAAAKVSSDGPGKEQSFPPVCLIEPLSGAGQSALKQLWRGGFDVRFERPDYQVQACHLGSLPLTLLLVECRSASILTILDPATGRDMHRRLETGDFPDLDALLHHLGNLAVPVAKAGA